MVCDNQSWAQPQAWLQNKNSGSLNKALALFPPPGCGGGRQLNSVEQGSVCAWHTGTNRNWLSKRDDWKKHQGFFAPGADSYAPQSAGFVAKLPTTNPPGVLGHKGRGRRRARRCCAVQLAQHLKFLEEYDPQNVIIMKRISRLGFKSQEVLQEFFEQFGPVDGVFLVNHALKASDVTYPHRLRPSGMGYVLMQNAKDVDAVFAVGGELLVRDTVILVRRFERRVGTSPASAGGDGGTFSDSEDDQAEHAMDYGRHGGFAAGREFIPGTSAIKMSV